MFFEQHAWQRKEKADSAAEGKAETVHRPGHILLVCLMLDAVSVVWKSPIAGHIFGFTQTGYI